MIFVVIGIIILVVSFIIALQSLIKEQSKAGTLEDSQKQLGEDMDTFGKQKERKRIGHAQSLSVHKQAPGVSDGYQNKQLLQEPFPWEKELESDQAKLARLKAELAHLKATKGVLNVDRSKEKGNDFGPSRNLSGEISLRDLKKKAV